MVEAVRESVRIRDYSTLPQEGVIFTAAEPVVHTAPEPTLMLPSPDIDIQRIREVTRAHVNLQAAQDSNVQFAMSPEHIARRQRTIIEAIRDGTLPRNRDLRRQALEALKGSVDHWKVSDAPSNV